MGSPEIIRLITDSRRKERETIEQKKLIQQRSPDEIAQVETRKYAEQAEANEMFLNMRIDCEDLLDNQGKIRRFSFSESEDGVANMFTKRDILETSIVDEEGEKVKVVLYSSGAKPKHSDEINLVVGALGSPIFKSEFGSFLSLERTQSYIVSPFGIKEKAKRTPNLEDARKWKEVVNALKEQYITDQSSPIEHK